MGRATHRLSLANVRTHTTRKTSPALQKHELYMRLTSLEIERSRRAAERDATAKRIAILDQRLEVIVSEQNHLRELLDQRSKSDMAENTTSGESSKVEPLRVTASKPCSKGLNLKY